MYRMLIADDEMIERAVLYKMLNKNLDASVRSIRQKTADRHWSCMKRRRSRLLF